MLLVAKAQFPRPIESLPLTSRRNHLLQPLMPLYAGLFVFLILPIPLAVEQGFCQAAATGTILGIVKSASGEAIGGAKITLKAENSRTESQATTNREGKYEFPLLTPGTYTLTVEYAGLEKAERAGVTVVAQQQTRVDLILNPAGTSSGTNTQKSGREDLPTLSGSFYDDQSLKASPLTSSGEAAGYSTGAQAEVSNRLLENMAGLGGRNGGEATEMQGLLQQEDSGRGNSQTAKEIIRGKDLSTRIKEYERAVQTESTEQNFFQWGDALTLQRMYPKAQEVFSRGLQVFPHSIKLKLGLGVAQYLQGMYEQAMTTFILASDLDPSDSRPYTFLGQAYSSPNAPRSSKTLAYLRRFVEVQPRNALAHYYYALGLRKDARGKVQDQGAEIESSLQRAIALDPQLADAHLQLGAIYEERQMLSEAADQYQQAARLQPGLAAVHYRLAKLYSQLGEKARASEELTQFENLSKQKTQPEPPTPPVSPNQ